MGSTRAGRRGPGQRGLGGGRKGEGERGPRGLGERRRAARSKAEGGRGKREGEGEGGATKKLPAVSSEQPMLLLVRHRNTVFLQRPNTAVFRRVSNLSWRNTEETQRRARGQRSAARGERGRYTLTV